MTANADVSTEAADLLQVHAGSAVFGLSTSSRIDRDVRAYATEVVDNWNSLAQGNESARVTAALNDTYKTLDAVTPRTAAQSDSLNQEIMSLNDVSQARSARALEAEESGSLPLVLWIAILFTTLVTLFSSLVFLLENIKVAYAMIVAVTAVLAVNLFVIVELGYPFIGSVAVGPGKFEQVIRLVGG